MIKKVKNPKLILFFIALNLLTLPSNAKIFSSSDSNGEYKAYIKSVEKRIYKNWAPPRYPNKKSTLIKFYINNDGSANDITVISSSGLTKFDEMAIDAIKSSSPFSPIDPPIKFR